MRNPGARRNDTSWLTMTEIPTGRLKRSGIAGATLLKVGGRHLQHAATRPFRSAASRDRQQQMLDTDTARMLFETFTQLRGTALKVAQMLSMETGLLPESMRKELSRAYHQVPPLGRPLVRKLLQQEFNQPPEALYAAFDSQAFAAASLGQVHAAQTHAGEPVAVKMQYPGIDITIGDDMQLLRSMLRRTRFADLMRSSLDEIERRLREEVDYLQEAKNTSWFRKQLQLEGVIIPRVYPALSSRRVLTTHRLEGLHLEQWLAQNPTQEQRNHYGQRLYDVFVQSFYGLHALHADPNPGNYLFMAADQLGLVDFGCVRHFSIEFTALMPVLLHAYMNNDPSGVIATYQQLGMIADMPENELQAFYQTTLRPFGDWLTQPFRSESFDFGSRGTTYTREGWKTIKQLSRVNKINGLADEFIFFDRTFFGLYQIFERMGAQVRMHHSWLI